MIGVTVTFSYAGDFDRSRVTKVAENARGMFEGMPGLRFKFFTFDEKQQRAVNFYVWDSEEAAERFFSEELRERVTGLYGAAPAIEFVEIAEIVDNSASLGSRDESLVSRLCRFVRGGRQPRGRGNRAYCLATTASASVD